MLCATSHVSGITLLGVPSEIYTHGTQYMVVALINVVVIFIVITVYLPVFYELQLTSVYEYLELRFHSNVRGFASLIFAVSLILYIPVVIYVPALAFNQVTGLTVNFITPIICVICIFYTTVGGLKAVVWTDAIQSLFTVVSVMAVIVLGFVQVGGIGNTINAAREGGRLELFKMDPDPFLRNTFWTVSIGTTFSWVTHLGIHPGAVQRFVALPTYAKARNALIYFVLGMAVVKILTCAVGLLIYAKYRDCDPVQAGLVVGDKNLLPFFVVDVAADFPGLIGLFIAGIFSAALSTMSAQLNTVSGTIYEDFVVKMMNIKVSELTASIIMKCTVVVVGFTCVCLVTVVEKLGGILQMAVSLGGVTLGATLTAFTLGVCFPRANTRGTLCGMVVSIGVMSWIVWGAQTAIFNGELKFVTKDVSVADCPANATVLHGANYTGLYRVNDDVYAGPDVPKMYTLSYMHYSTLGTFIGIAVGLAVSLLFPDPEQVVDPKLLTPWIRKFARVKCAESTEPTKAAINAHQPQLDVSRDTKL